MSYTTEQYTKAIDGLKSFENLEGEALRSQLTQCINTLSIEAEGKTTVLYAGSVNGENATKIAQEMIQIIGK